MDKPLMPTQIKKLTGFGLNNVSDILRLFVKKKVAICLNEKERLGRLYQLTSRGKKVMQKVKKMTIF